MGEPWRCSGCGAPSAKTERVCSCATACLFKKNSGGRALKDDAFASEADTAFLRGVKAGLEAAAEWADWLGAQYSVATERGVLIKPASSGIRAIDPATVKEPSDG